MRDKDKPVTGGERAGKLAEPLLMDNPLMTSDAQKTDNGDDTTKVTLVEPDKTPTDDLALWVAIRNATRYISFEEYNNFITDVLCAEGGGNQPGPVFGDKEADGCRFEKLKIGQLDQLEDRWADLNHLPTIQSVDAYNLLRVATEIFLLVRCGVVRKANGETQFCPPPTEDDMAKWESKYDITKLLQNYFPAGNIQLPFLQVIVANLFGDKSHGVEGLPFCADLLKARLTCPSMIELIWSYWHEEGMLSQAMNVVSLRFQNRRLSAEKDPLAHLDLAYLRPLNNLLWGHVQSEYSRLTVKRRAYEYDHHYGITLYGKAVPSLRSVDSRSKFLQAFHDLLYRCSIFFQDDSNMTINADAFPLLNAIKEVHLVLAEGMHNQYGDLPWTARVEMLIEQWLLSRPEMSEFLRGKVMPYNEPWMSQVDTIKRLEGWTDSSVSYFSDLGVFGEKILLSLRFGNWTKIIDPDNAKTWARHWKAEIQGYLHAYRTVTGVDLTKAPVDTQPPWVHLRKRLMEQQKRTNGK